MRILCCILFLPFVTIGQATFIGTIFNKTNNSKVPFATIGLLKENIGTNADENGHFELKSIHPKPMDSLMISSVGFVTQKIAITDHANTDLDIQLIEQVTTLREVLIDPGYKWTKVVLNDFSDCGNYFITSSGYMQQLAQHFIAPTDNARLIKVNICRMSGGLFNPLRTMLHIRVYDIDTLTGGPGSDLCNKLIEVTSKNGSISLNVESYKIILPNKDFFVAIEWLKIPYNQQIMPKHTIDGMERVDTVYTPGIGFQNTTVSQQEAWELDYNGKWQPFSSIYQSKKSISLAATIKY